MDSVECIVVGAGVVGLAIARALAAAGREVLVLEAEASIGSGISSRNSEVIHAGIYYPHHSLMAQLCLQGRDMLYTYCDQHGVPYQRRGKLLVATTPQEAEKLPAIASHALANGVTDLRQLSAAEARALEPQLHCSGALLSPSTGVLDSAAYLRALRGDAEADGAMIAFHAPLLHAQILGTGFKLQVGGPDPMTLGCKFLVNAAGLGAIALAKTMAKAMATLPGGALPNLYLAKGNYFSCTARVPFNHLIYPLPVPGGLGIHLALDIGNQPRFGPDVEWIEAVDYRVDPSRAAQFYPAIRRYWPDLPEGALTPAYAGIRPKISAPGAMAQDFRIQTPQDHGVSGLVQLFGIESPGLTASLAIGRYVAQRLLS